jgi:hypothetical protein
MWTSSIAASRALFRRVTGAHAASPSAKPVFEGNFRRWQEVILPETPDGIGWTTVDLRQTLGGRLISPLFRLPALFITIRDANGLTHRYRLLSDLTRAGFLMTPPRCVAQGTCCGRQTRGGSHHGSDRCLSSFRVKATTDSCGAPCSYCNYA